MADEAELVQGSASIVIDRPIDEVWGAVTDITRMGEWSPECLAGRWVAPASGPAVGATFEGDNAARMGPVTLKKWTTVSEVTESDANKTFEFVAEGYSTWRYDFASVDGGTRLTESFSYPAYGGWQAFAYETLLRRSKSMVAGMEKTLATIKTSLES